MRRLWLGLALAVAVALALGAGWWALRVRASKQYGDAVQEAKAAISAGSVAKARQVLACAAALRPEQGEAQIRAGQAFKPLAGDPRRFEPGGTGRLPDGPPGGARQPLGASPRFFGIAGRYQEPDASACRLMREAVIRFFGDRVALL